jgi:hypothetical protein
MAKLPKFPKIKYADQGTSKKFSSKENVMALVGNMIDRPIAHVEEMTEVVNGVQWCRSIRIYFEIPTGEKS